MKRNILLVVVGVLLIILGALLFGYNNSTDVVETNVTRPAEDPIDAVLDFYNVWHENLLSTSSTMSTEELVAHPRLSDDVRSYITEAMEAPDSTADPVLCLETVPPRVGAKIVFVTDSAAQLQVLGRGMPERTSVSAIVDLGVADDQWQITNIRCSTGESAPEREFTFDREGFLLKSVPPPLNSDYWHLVFEEAGVQGHTAPLFFDADSVCIAADGAESVCDENTFTDATPALVQGEMTEAGVAVKRVVLQNGE